MMTLTIAIEDEATSEKLVWLLNSMKNEGIKILSQECNEDDWDQKIGKDATSGRLDTLFAEDIAEFESGKCKKI